MTKLEAALLVVARELLNERETMLDTLARAQALATKERDRRRAAEGQVAVKLGCPHVFRTIDDGDYCCAKPHGHEGRHRGKGKDGVTREWGQS